MFVSVVAVAVTALEVVGRGNNEERVVVGDCVTPAVPNEMLAMVAEMLVMELSVVTGIGIGIDEVEVVTTPVPCPIPVPPPTAAMDMFEWREDANSVGDGDRTPR